MAKRLLTLPIGTKIKFGKHQINNETPESIVWIIVAKNHSNYPQNSVTLITEKVIDFRAFDGGETDWLGSRQTTYGYSSYMHSNINQWLNAVGGAGQWYAPAHDNDAPPTGVMYEGEYASRPGFLNLFTEDERRALLETTLNNQRGTNALSTFTTKVFLPSVWELLGTHTVADGSSIFEYFTTNGAAAYPTQQVVDNTIVTSYVPENASSPFLYWTRNGETYNVRQIDGAGAASEHKPYLSCVGIRPCANVSDTVIISETPDSDGCYTISLNNAPTISGTDSDLGIKDSGFTLEYDVFDVEEDAYTVTEYIDNIKLRSYVATSDSVNSFEVQNATWWGLANGTHTMRIVATDGYDTSERRFTFNKSINELVVQRTTPIESSTMPKTIIVSVVKNIPFGAIFKVEVCNNGFADEPAWEDITNDVINGDKYDFQNTDLKGSAKWGVNIRVTVKRNDAQGACFITEIGGNFE